MGAEEETTPAKTSKSASSTQGTSVMPTYSDWSNSMQAYYSAAGAHSPYFVPPVGSPAPPPYIWSSQHPMMPPYGTPYPTMYAPGGVYAHPNMSTTPASTKATGVLEGKASNGKDQLAAKKPRATLGTADHGVKARESAKATSGSGNDGASQSGDSGTEGSTDASDENNNQQELSANNKKSFSQMLADGANAQNNAAPGKPVLSMASTNLNMRMDLWNASAGGGTVKMGTNPTSLSPAVAPGALVVPEGMGDPQWIQRQDERELKRQKRKQSNRESARRSRLRKQAECEELQHRVETLSNENRSLRDELLSLSEECQKLTSENNSIEEELRRLHGPDAVSNLEDNNPAAVNRTRGDEGDS